LNPLKRASPNPSTQLLSEHLGVRLFVETDKKDFARSKRGRAQVTRRPQQKAEEFQGVVRLELLLRAYLVCDLNPFFRK
jgi:hypothetical protein